MNCTYISILSFLNTSVCSWDILRGVSFFSRHSHFLLRWTIHFVVRYKTILTYLYKKTISFKDILILIIRRGITKTIAITPKVRTLVKITPNEICIVPWRAYSEVFDLLLSLSICLNLLQCTYDSCTEQSYSIIVLLLVYSQ